MFKHLSLQNGPCASMSLLLRRKLALNGFVTNKQMHSGSFLSNEKPNEKQPMLMTEPQVDPELYGRLRRIIWDFRAPIRVALAYGSGVFSQTGPGATDKKPMIDLIFGVTYPHHWHSINMAQYPEHYSFLKYFGSWTVSAVQQHFGAKIYYNTLIEMRDLTIKYGVVSVEDMVTDLKEWNTFYIAGRLHKPVRVLRDYENMKLENVKNLLSGLRLALLKLPEQFSEAELYETITRLSYDVDPRSRWAENPKKVKNIVENQMSNFRTVYSPLFLNMTNLETMNSSLSDLNSTSVRFCQDLDPQRRGNMVLRLPINMRRMLYNEYGLNFKETNTFENKPLVLESDIKIARDGSLPQKIDSSLKKLARYPAISQSLKGLFTAGPRKSFIYSSAKLGKKFR